MRCKKLLVALLTLALFLSASAGVLPQFGTAAANPVTVAHAADSDFVITDGVLTKYNGSGGNVLIPDSVTSIGNEAFEYCSSLKSITIPDSVTSIGNKAFYYCSSLKSITIPDSVTSIGNEAFYHCSSLTSITIGNTVTSIGERTFSDCSRLTGINVSDNNQKFSSVDGVLYDKTKKKLIACPEGKSGSITIPNSVTSIGNGVFYNCSRLTSITIPDSVTSIGNEAFYNCSSLKSITIPDSVSSIGNQAFYKCSGLTSITIPDSVTSIGKEAFYHCNSLTSITIPNSVTSIGNGAFYECSSLTSITIGNTVTSIGERTFSYCSSLTSITIPDSVTSIGNLAFYDCSRLTSITIGNSVTSIGNRAFDGCSSLKSITIPDSVTSIGKEAFYHCSSLTSITIPDSVTWIGDEAFYYCSNLTSITIGNSVTSIGDGAFYNCSSLTSINVSDNNQKFSIVDGVLYDKPKKKLIACPERKSGSITIPNSVTSIGNGAFYNCSSLTSITIPDSVTSIGNWAFYNCSSLTSITIPKSIRSDKYGERGIGDGAFSNCKELKDIFFTGSRWKWFNMFGDGSILGLTDNVTIHFKYDKMPLSIITQPTSKNVRPGSYGELWIKAEGDDLTYQWYYKMPGQTSWKKWTGQIGYSVFTDNPTSSIEGFFDKDMQFYCVVNDLYGGSVQSDTVTITVKPEDLKIITQPTSKTVKLGSNVTLSIKAEGYGLTYQWYYKKAGQTSWKKWDYSISRTTTYTTTKKNSTWNGNTSSSITGTSDATWNGMQVYCVVKDSYGHSVQSNTVTITVTQGLKITTQPTGKTIKSGSSVTLSLKAEGDGLTYQWYYQKAGQTKFSAWENRTHASETCKPNATWNGIQLYCIVKDRNGNSVQSNTIKVTFSDVVTIVTQPANVSAKAGESVKLTVKAEGVGLSYQWYYKKSGAKSWTKWSKQTKSTVSFKMASGWNKAQFYCQVKNKAGKRVKTQSAKATLLVEFKITTQPKNKTVKTGKTATFSIKATGNGLKYQWYYKKKGAKSWTKWSGKTKASVSLKATKVWNGAQFYCKVTDGNKKTANSKSAKLTLKK